MLQQIDKRKERRVRKKIKISIQHQGETAAAASIDISRHGVKVRSKLALEPDKQIVVTIISGNNTAMQMNAVVRWRREVLDDISDFGSIESGLFFPAPPLEFLELLPDTGGRTLSEFLDQLPSMPVIILDLMSMLNDGSQTVIAIEKKIKTDQNLVAHLLRVINSPFYGLSGKVTSISKTITLMGYSALKSMLMSYFSKQLCHLSGNKKLARLLWEHSLRVGLLAKFIAIELKIDEEEGYIAGLLHDIGQSALAMLAPDNYHKLMETYLAGQESILTLEDRLFAFTHVEIGLYLMTRWDFAPIFCDALQYHHSDESYSGKNKLVAVTALANLLDYKISYGKNVDIERLSGKLALSSDQLNEIGAAMQQHWQAMA